MAKSELSKFVKKTASKKKGHHPEVVFPGLGLTSDKDFGNREFSINWQPIIF